MCGILGSIDRPFDEDTLDLLHHRGPDDGAICRREMARRLLTLGHRRLSILDLSAAGRQPMWTPCGHFGIVFNGEIYNHLELRKASDRVRYVGHSDTETLLHYLAENGFAGLERLNGIFAFAFIDQSRNRLYLVRDAFGVKPLYYCREGRSFVFSSELAPILRLVDDTLDPAHLARLLKLRYNPSPDTLFKKIRKLRPGHVLELDLSSGELAMQEYPFTRPNVSPCAALSRSEAAERYGFHVRQSVERQLLSDVKVGVLLSGGVDSALVARLAQERCGYKMPAFTVGFSTPDQADEVEAATQTANTIGLEHHVVRMGLSDFLNLLPAVTGVVEEPVATTSMLPMFYLSGLASRHVKVVLSGQGVDEVLGGYRRYQIELLRSCVPGFALSAAAWLPGAAFRLRNDTLRRSFISLGQKDDIRRFESVYSVFTDSEIQELIGSSQTSATDRIRYFYDLLECSSRRHSVERMMALDLRMNLPDDLLLYTDKVTMRHSLECRVPFLDADLIRFVESLPCRYRLGLNSGKRIHKQYARRILPSSITRRKKKGFLSPTGQWFRDARVREMLLDRSSQFATVFSLRKVEDLWNQHQRGINRERQIFLLLSLSCWMHRYLGTRSPECASAASSR